ncbi:alpha-glucuronidase [uncultured Bacteroides sp.]|uniref:alpha-glucuronidase n=1 Tax=uncultured Bacteroides sp. TaxID=162156 RepID=UPI002AAAF851|nr:alpha-glucuronidase [uncultured Bacteroides sp.]
MKKYLALLIGSFLSLALKAEKTDSLWFRNYTPQKAEVICKKHSPTLTIAASELRKAWQGIPVELRLQKGKEYKELGQEGFTIRTSADDQKIVLSSMGEEGILYGAYHLLRLQQTGELTSPLDIKESPSYKIRILNHWDNLDGTVERGYAGHSIWQWDKLPDVLSPRYTEYARANASIGINATVLNNVNASPQMLSTEYLQKVKALAEVFRPYKIKVYLSINFSSPAELGGLPTSDPLDAAVRCWWKKKADEIYKLIPDFGGFLVKANSEGLPGPQDFGRTHADGANMLADALKPHGGIVMWRAFVYSPGDSDRAKQAYQEFMPLDGQFRENVIIQVKNGPIDFQPREPFSPLFGAMKKTAVMPEFQITQEYLGFANHLVYLAPLWKECLESDTYQQGKGSTVARVTDGSIYPHQLTAIAAVANIGDDANWCGHPFAQANWYSFGRLAWNHELTSAQIADEWISQTFPKKDFLSKEKETCVPLNADSWKTLFLPRVRTMMLESREAAVDYMMPLGLHHQFAFGHHYGPQPWCDVPGARADWLPKYYHKADSAGIGFDRSSTGSNAVSQYQSPLCEEFDDVATCPENLLLWFHHVSWNYKMKSGRTLWDELCYTYDRGVQEARSFQKTWDMVKPFVDKARFDDVQRRLKIQTRDAVWWKDACLLYFQQFSRRPIPCDIERPIHDLDRLEKYHLKITNYENAFEGVGGQLLPSGHP